MAEVDARQNMPPNGLQLHGVGFAVPGIPQAALFLKLQSTPGPRKLHRGASEQGTTSTTLERKILLIRKGA